MNRGQVFGPEEIADVGGNAGKSSPVAGHDQEQKNLEQQGIGGLGKQEECDDLQREEGGVGVGPARVIGEGGPPDPSPPVE